MRKISKKIVFLLVILSLSFFSIGSSYAALTPTQAAGSITGQIDPGRVSTSIGPKQFAPPKAMPKISTETTKELGITDAEKIYLDLHQVIFSGNTVFSNKQLNEIFAVYLHKNISLAQLQALVGQVTASYRAAGYILSKAILPPQEIKKGIVHVQIIEGFIDNVKIEGDVGSSRSLVQAYAQHIIDSRPLKLSVLEKYLLIINDLPDIDAQSVLYPSKSLAGGADLTLIIKKIRFNANLLYNNYGTRYIGPIQTTANASLYSIFAPSDINMGQIVTTPRNELRFGELVHTQPIGSNGLNIGGGTSYTETRPQFVLSPLDIVGRDFNVFGTATYPLIRSRSKNLYLQGTMNYQNVTSTILSSLFYYDLIRSVTVGAVFNNIDSWHGINIINFFIEHGFPILGAADHFYQSRPEGKVLFTKETATISRLQNLSSRFSVLASAQGQYTNVPLLATEQFGFGGPEYGRGYDPSEIVGDKGIGGKLEGRIDTFPELHFLQSVQYYIFYDVGEIWNFDKTNLPPQQSATSIGLGLRFTIIKEISGNLYIAKPLTREVSTMVLLGSNATAPRGFFQLVASI